MSIPPSFQPENQRQRPTAEHAHKVARRSIRPQENAPHSGSQDRKQAASTVQSSKRPDLSRASEHLDPSQLPSFAPKKKQRLLDGAAAHSIPAPNPFSAAQQGGQAQAPVHPIAPSRLPTFAPHAQVEQQAPRQSPPFYPTSPGPHTPTPTAQSWQPRQRESDGQTGLVKRRHWGRRLFFFFLVIVLLVAAWAAFLVTDANRHLGRTDALGETSSSDGITYLIAGSDSRADGAVQDHTAGQRADSIMVVNVAPNGQASAVSIPRDTYVEIPNSGWNKINASFAFGGDALLVSTVEHLTGLSVDHYVEVGMGGVANIVDAVGGVNLCYDQTVSDELSGLNWEAGCHDADGKTALAFSRMRYSDPLGDIGRAERQRQVVTKAVSKALSPSTLINPVSAFRLERAGSKALVVDQDSSVLDIGRLALAFKQASADQLTGAPPIESLGYATEAGSAVLLEGTTAPAFFEKMRSGTLDTSDFAALGK